MLKVGGMVAFEHPAGPIDVQLQVRTWAHVGCVRSRLQFVLKVEGMVVFEHPAGPIDVQLQVRIGHMLVV